MGLYDRDYMRSKTETVMRTSPEDGRIVLVIISIAVVIGLFAFFKPRQPAPYRMRPAPQKPLFSLSQELGPFHTASGMLIVTDAGENRETAVQGNSYVSAQPGEWSAMAILTTFSPHNRQICTELHAYHLTVENRDTLIWNRGHIYVDDITGMAGFFDIMHFRDATIVPSNLVWSAGKPAYPHALWYSFCLEMIANKPAGTVIPHGVVVHAGFRKGGRLYTVNNADNKAVALKLVFSQKSEME